MNFFHSRLLIRRIDDRVRCKFFLLFWRDRSMSFFHCRWFSWLVSWSSRCDYECEFAYEEAQISKNTTTHDLSDRIVLSKQLQHHCHEQHTLIRTHNLLNRHEQWLHELRVFSKYRQIENFDVCDVKTLDSIKTH